MSASETLLAWRMRRARDGAGGIGASSSHSRAGLRRGPQSVIGVMHADGLSARRRRCLRVMIDSDHPHRIARNLVRRLVSAGASRIGVWARRCDGPVDGDRLGRSRRRARPLLARCRRLGGATELPDGSPAARRCTSRWAGDSRRAVSCIIPTRRAVDRPDGGYEAASGCPRHHGEHRSRRYDLGQCGRRKLRQHVETTNAIQARWYACSGKRRRR